MKKIDLGQTITILSNIGVLIGIVLLVFELNQSRQMMRAQTRTEIAQGSIDALNLRGTNGDVRDLWERASSEDGLPETERGQFSLLVSAVFRYHENVHYQYRLGLYDEAEFDAQRNAWRGIYNQRGPAIVWCRNRNTFSPDFVAEINDLMTEFDCEQLPLTAPSR
jgi:hypothetical protein